MAPAVASTLRPAPRPKRPATGSDAALAAVGTASSPVLMRRNSSRRFSTRLASAVSVDLNPPIDPVMHRSYVKRALEGPETALDILQFKLDVLWQISDAIEKAYP